MKTCSKLACRLLSVILLLPFSSFGQSSKSNPVDNGFKSGSESGVYFIENAGQVHDEFDQPRPDVVAIGVSAMSQLLIKSSGYAHQLNRFHYRVSDDESQADDLEPRLVDSVQFSRVDLNWMGANSDVLIEHIKQRKSVHNYFNVPHQPKGITGVREFSSVRLMDVYPGINIRFYDACGLFEHDYEIAPGADYRDIQVEIKGAGAYLNNHGELVLKTALGTITESSPRVFQNGRELESRWVQLEENVWGFEVPEAHPELAMVIDPISRVWGTYYGGSNLDEILYSRFDPWGNLYVMGGAQSTNNIATSGTEQVTIGGGLDAFLARFDEDGNQIWGTYIGGNNSEEAWGCDFDVEGNIFITGRTNSTTNISTPGSHQVNFGGGGFDGFIQKFDPAGIRIWGTFYGGEEYDRGRYCHVDADGFLYMAGVTKSFSNISTPGSHQEEYGGAGQNDQDDAILVKFTPEGERIWGTYYGGINWEEGYSCDTDSDLNVYLYGHAQSSTSISTPGSHQPNHGGGLWDSFLVKFNADGVRQWGTYIGGSSQDLSWTCSIDGSDHIYVTGRTASNNAIATAGVHQETNGGDFDAYLMKFNDEGEQVWGTYLGGSQYDRGFGCATIENDKILISGHTESDAGIATTGSHQENFGGGIDAFLALFGENGELEWSTYYGGDQNDVGRSTTYYNQAYYLAGWTQSDSNISTSGVHQENLGGGRDAFIAKFIVCENSYNTISIDACNSFTAPDNVVYSESGEYTAVLPNNSGCDSIISISLTINPMFEENNSVSLCDGETYTLPNGNVVDDSGIYTSDFVSGEGCDSTILTTVNVFPNYNLDFAYELCENDTLIDPEGNLLWDAGEYTYEFNSVNGCDSIIQWSLEESPAYIFSTSAEICEGEEYITPGGQTLNETTTIEEVFFTSAGCDSTFITDLTVLPIYAFNIDTTICDNESYTLPDGSVAIEPGLYSFEYTTQLGCDSIYSISLEVTPDIEIFEYYELCTGETFELPDGTITQPENNTEYQINIAAENGCDTLYNISVQVFESYEVNTTATICEGATYQLPDGVFVSASGNYTSIVSTTAGCDSVVNTNLQVEPAPEIIFDLPDAFCFEEGFVPISPTPPGGSLSGDFAEENGINLENVPAGEYAVYYDYTDENGCSVQVEKTYSVLPVTQPSFTYNADCLYRVAFINETNGSNLNFEWLVDSVYFSDENTPSYEFSEDGEYTIQLIATNAAGCEYGYSQIATLSDGLSLDDFWIPNIITPNGDGKNDVLKSHPEDQNCIEYEIMIFNRWGMKVYESNHSGVLFSGRDIDGQVLPDGTYFYILESPQFNCEDSEWADFCQGTITILR